MFARIRYTSTDCSLPCDTSTRGRQPRRRPGTRHGRHRLSTSPGSRGARAAGDRWAWSAGGRVGTVAASSSPWVTDETLLPTWLSWKGNSAEEQTLPSRQLGCIPSEGFRGDSSFRCKHPEIPALQNPVRASSWWAVSFKLLCLPSKAKRRSRHRVAYFSKFRKKSKQQAVEQKGEPQRHKSPRSRETLPESHSSQLCTAGTENINHMLNNKRET